MPYRKTAEEITLFSFYGVTQCQVMLALAVVLATVSHPLGISATIAVGVPFWKNYLEKEKQLYKMT